MADIIESKRTVRVEVTHFELTNLLIDPAKDADLIDFDPTRVSIQQLDSGDFSIVFERMET